MTAAVPVLIVDDQAAFRSAARTVVALASGFEVVDEADSGELAVEKAAGLHDGLVLMDINLGGITGIEATRRITEGRDDLVVVLMSTYTADDLPQDAGECGAATYVHKEDLAPDVLVHAWEQHTA